MVLRTKYPDPRRPESIITLGKEPIDKPGESDPGFAFTAVALAAGAAGFFFQNRWPLWVALFFAVLGLTNHTGGNSSSGSPPTGILTFAIMVLVSTYAKMINSGELFNV